MSREASTPVRCLMTTASSATPLPICPSTGARCATGCPGPALDVRAKQTLKGADSLTSWLKRAADRFQHVLAALGVLSLGVAFAGPYIVYTMLDVSPDSVGLTAAAVTLHGLGSLTVAALAAAVAYGSARALVRPRTATRVRRHNFKTPWAYRPYKVKADFLDALILRTLRVQLAVALVLAGLVSYESDTLPLARVTSGSAVVFALLFWGALATAVVLLLSVAVGVAWPRTMRWLIVWCLRRLGWYRRHPAGMLITVTVAVGLAAAAVTMAAGSAVLTELRSGHEPGLLGKIVGIDASCVIVDTPTMSKTPMLVIGEGLHDTVALADGVVHWLPPNLARHQVDASECVHRPR
jgi:hypothetical protein